MKPHFVLAAGRPVLKKISVEVAGHAHVIEVGSLVRLRHGSEAWAFSKNKTAVRKIAAMRWVNHHGGGQSVFFTLAGRKREVGLEEIEPA